LEGSNSYIYEQTELDTFSVDFNNYTALARDDLDFNDIKLSNSVTTNITTDLNLPGLGNYSTSISWASNNTAIRATDGYVTRPTYGASNATVNLTATISRTGYTSYTKEFLLTVTTEELTDALAVSTAKTDLDFNDIKLSNSGATDVTTDLDLITAGTGGTTISWASDNAAISTAGSVTRQSLNTSVVLTATITKGSSSTTDAFTIIVVGTSNQNLLDVADAKANLTDALVLNGNSLDAVIADLKFPANLSGHTGVTIAWASDDTTTINNSGSVTRSASADQSVVVNATLTKGGNSTVKRFSFTVKKTVAAIVAAVVNVTEGVNEVVIDATNGATVETIAVLSDVPDDEPVVVNFESVLNTSGAAPTVTVSTNLTISRETTVANYSVELSSGTVVTGTEDWNGLISIPTVQLATDFVAPVVSGKTTAVNAVVEVGVIGVRLNFSTPVKLVLAGMTGKKAAFNFEGSQLTKITTQCASATDYTGIPTAGECYFDNNTDLIIWTYHFSRFSAYTETDVVAAVVDDDDAYESSVETVVIPTKSAVWSTVNAGETKTMTIGNANIFADSIDVEFISDLTNAKLTIKQVTTPANTKEGTVYAYLEITKENFENTDVSSASIKFRVTNAWLSENAVSKEDIALFRYSDGWEALDTSISSEDDTNVYYTALTDGFSTFAIGVKEAVVEPVVEPEIIPPEEVPEEVPPEEVPPVVPVEKGKGWMLVAIIIIVVGLLLFLVKKKEKEEMKKHGVHEPHDHHEKLHNYVKHRISKGHKHEHIKKSLVDAGWKEDVVDKALKKHKK